MFKIEKHFKYIFIIFTLFLVNIDCVTAATNDKIYQICDNSGDKGYFYLTKFSSGHNDETNVGMFYNKDGNTIVKFLPPTVENVRSGYNYSLLLNGNKTKVSYAYGGYYWYNGKAENTTHCYTTIETEGNESNGKTTIQPNYCGESRLINVGDGGKESGDILISTSLNSSTGLITVTLTANSNYLKENWNYVKVTSINYEGAGTDHESTLRAVREGNKFVIYGVKPNEGNGTFTVTLAIENNSKTDGVEDGSVEADAIEKMCGSDLFLGEFATVIDDAASLELDNTYRNSELCKQVKNFTLASEDFKKGYIYECYNEKISYSEKVNVATSVDSKFKTIKSIYNDTNLNTANGGLAYSKDLICTNKDLGLPSSGDSTTVPFERKVTYEYSGNYWGMVCIQDYYVESDNPQLVKGGMGVHYGNKVEINKTCYIYNKKIVQKKPQCSLIVHDPVCVHPGGVTWTDMTTGGPTEEFDSCVNNCDGGKYTQSCINKCYSSVYSSDRKLSQFNTKNNETFINKVTADEKKSSCEFSSNSGKDNCGSNIRVSCDPNQYCAKNGKNGTCTVKKGEQTLQTVCYSAWCNNQGTSCSVSWTEGPSGCSWNPNGDYDRELQDSRDELNGLESLMEQRSEIENYAIQFTDSDSGVIYKVSGNSREDGNTAPNEPRLNIEEDIQKTGELASQQENFQIGSDTSNASSFEKGIKFYSHRTVYNITLPIQYSLKDDPYTILVKGSSENKYFTFNANNTVLDDGNAYYNFIGYNVDNKLLSNGESVYYTSLDARDKNVKTHTGNYDDDNKDSISYEVNDVKITKTLEAMEKNIKVSFTIENVGSDKSLQGTGLTVANGKIHEFKDSGYCCYYGVVNLLKGDGTNPPDPTPSPTGGGEPAVEGLMYYYREIYLNPLDNNGYGGVFPNGRSPRWNWTGTITNDGVVTGAANNDDKSYIVDPEKLIQAIESKGDSVFTDQSEYDYVFTMDRSIINKIRNYNDGKNDDGSKRTYLDFSLVGTAKDKKNYSKMISEWYSNLSPSVLVQISGCNNAKTGKCSNN